MTVLELLAAAALAAMLSTAVLGILGLLAKQAKQLKENHPQELWQQRLAEQLEWDILNSRSFIARNGELRLLGYAGSAGSEKIATHRPTEIIYAVEQFGEQNWLVREEVQLDSLSNRNRHCQVAAVGIRTMAVSLLDSLPAETDSSQGTLDQGLHVDLLDAENKAVVNLTVHTH
jgi:hypothetical protein